MEWEKKQIAGNTWCVEMPRALVPYYHLDKHEIILLDSGNSLNGEFENWLAEEKLHVQAILNTHNHWDHTTANGALQQRDGAKVYMPAMEGILHQTDIGMFLEHALGNFEKVVEFEHDHPFTVDELVDLQDGPLTVCGAEFQVVHTPGHTVDHTSYITPDNVLYVGDTLMSKSLLRTAKINYALSHEVDLKSKEKLRNYQCEAYVLAHLSIEKDLNQIIDWNIQYVHQRADQLWRMVEGPMSMEEIIRTAWRGFSLRGGIYFKNMEVSGMIRSLVQLLVSEKRLEVRHYDGVDYYAHTKKQEEQV